MDVCINSRVYVPAAGGGPPAFDNAGRQFTAASSASTLNSFALGGGSNRLVLASVSFVDAAAGTATITGCTFNGVAMTAVPSSSVSTTFSSGAYECTGQLFYMLEAELPASGSYNVVGNASEACDGLIVGVSSWSGVHQTTPLNTANTASSATTGEPSVALTSASGEVAVAMAQAVDDSPAAWNGQDTERWIFSAGAASVCAGMESINSTGASETVNWTGNHASGQGWLATGVSIKPA